VIAGIGVNLNSEPEDFPPALRPLATSLRVVSGALVDRARFVARLLHRLEVRYDQFLREGFATIAPSWEELSELTGETILVQSQGERIEGTVLGLADDGALRVREGRDGERRIVAGDVTVVGGYRRARAEGKA